MKLLTLLSYYDEDPGVLARCVDGAATVGCGCMVAVDGAYASWGDPQPRSAWMQRVALEAQCVDRGIALTHHVPVEPWRGDEVLKRTFMHRLADSVADPCDWLLVLDADMVVDRVALDLRTKLVGSRYPVAEVTVQESGGGRYPCRLLFRADQRIGFLGNHRTYVDLDSGKILASPDPDRQCPATDLTGLVISHRPARDEQKQTYYRHAQEFEHNALPCDRCAAPATDVTRTHHRVMDGALLSDPTWVCDECFSVVTNENLRILALIGARS